MNIGPDLEVSVQGVGREKKMQNRAGKQVTRKNDSHEEMHVRAPITRDFSCNFSISSLTRLLEFTHNSK